MDNVILTAHVASASARFDPARKRRVGQEIALVLQRPLAARCVNPAVLEKTELRRWQPYSMERGPRPDIACDAPHLPGLSRHVTVQDMMIAEAPAIPVTAKGSSSMKVGAAIAEIMKREGVDILSAIRSTI